MVFAHSFIGVPITYYLIKNKPELWKEKFNLNLLFLIGIVGSVFPDFDLTLSFFVHDLNHRKLISHSIVPYLILFFINFLVFKTFKKNKEFYTRANLIFFVSVLIHLIIDLFVGGISLFAPFTSNIFGFDIYFDKSTNFFISYLFSWYMFFELIFIFYSTYFIFKFKNIIVNLILPFFFLLIACAMVLKYLN